MIDLDFSGSTFILYFVCLNLGNSGFINPLEKFMWFFLNWILCYGSILQNFTVLLFTLSFWVLNFAEISPNS